MVSENYGIVLFLISDLINVCDLLYDDDAVPAAEAVPDGNGAEAAQPLSAAEEAAQSPPDAVPRY